MTHQTDSSTPLSVLRIYWRRRRAVPGHGVGAGLLADAVLLRLDGVQVLLRGVPA